MDQLVEYPYGCVEQLSSRLVPFVATREVERVFGQPPHPDQVVTDTVAKIEALQAPSGGFLYWPNATCPYAWPSIYAALALARAEEMDYPVHKDVLVRARRYLASIAAGESTIQYVLPSTVQKFAAKHPGISLALNNVTGMDGLQQLRERRVDFCVGPLLDTPPDLEFEPIVGFDPVLESLTSLRFHFWSPALARVGAKARELLQ